MHEYQMHSRKLAGVRQREHGSMAALRRLLLIVIVLVILYENEDE